MVIKNGLVFKDNNTFEKMNIHIKDGIIHGVNISDGKDFDNACTDSDSFDAKDCYVIPGLIDLHLHGAVGCDFCDASFDSIKAIVEYECLNGITTICPTTMSISKEKLEAILASISDYLEVGSDFGNHIAGVNMEGPYISPAKCGAQAKDNITTPDFDYFDSLITNYPEIIKLVDVAPEVSGVLDLTKKYKDTIRFSFAHSSADYDTAKASFEAGISEVTHIGNAMNQISSRIPGPMVAAAENCNVMAELIADGIHIHPAVVRMLFKIFGDDRLILISDSMEACGLADGQYTLGGQNVTVRGKVATLSDSSKEVIAGSVSNLMDCVKTAILDMQLPIESVIKCATVNPAKALGIFDRVGSITVGKRANLVVLNKNFDIIKVFY